MWGYEKFWIILNFPGVDFGMMERGEHWKGPSNASISWREAGPMYRPFEISLPTTAWKWEWNSVTEGLFWGTWVTGTVGNPTLKPCRRPSTTKGYLYVRPA
jgi:hypothetical protein